MGWFDSLFGRRAPQVQDPEELWRLLFGAAQAGDDQQLQRLCRVNRDAIVAHFPAWQKVPEAVRANPEAVQPYAHALIAVAQTFANRLDTPDLLQRLMGSGEDNPLARWMDGLRRSQELMGELRYSEARQLLTDLLIDVRGLRGSGADHYLPITLGQLGECYFQSGEADKAVGPWQQALALCRQHGDAEGVAAYLGNLYEAHRYLGQAEPAAACAAELADVLEQQGQPAEAARHRQQAAIVRAGEPLNRIVALVNGRRYDPDEAPTVRDGKVQFLYERNRITLQPAVVQIRRGEELGSAGRYEEALEAFRAAAHADPFDPQSRYEEGLTLLCLGRYAEAVEIYEAAERLAPGWFNCRSDLWLARQLALGTLDHGVFLALRRLEDDTSLDAAAKVRLAEEALRQAPRVALLHLFLGRSLADGGRPKDAESAYRQGLACVEDPDVKTRLLLNLGVVVKSPEERTRLLQEARALNGNLTAAAMAVFALK